MAELMQETLSGATAAYELKIGELMLQGFRKPEDVSNGKALGQQTTLPDESPPKGGFIPAQTLQKYSQ